ncbi:MAG: hypothetical protein ABH950_01590 [Candidatus Altiarchaeota archaeon]
MNPFRMVFSILIFFGLAVVLSSESHATTLVAPHLVISCQVNETLLENYLTCINEECSINISGKPGSVYFDLNLPGIRQLVVIEKNNGEYNLRVVPTQILKPPVIDDFFEAMDRICPNDPGVKAVISEAVTREGEREVLIEPYTEKREAELQETTNDATECSYDAYERMGDWLLIFPNRYQCQYIATINTILFLGLPIGIIFTLIIFFVYRKLKRKRD